MTAAAQMFDIEPTPRAGELQDQLQARQDNHARSTHELSLLPIISLLDGSQMDLGQHSELPTSPPHEQQGSMTDLPDPGILPSMASTMNSSRSHGGAPGFGCTITVIVPTFNRASILASTLASVFNQTIPVDQVILVDDGSTDDTESRVAALLDDNPSWSERFLFLRHESNCGKSVALNRGLKRSLGTWIAFNDSDDHWKPDKLQRQFDALSAFPDCGACFTDSVYVTGGSQRDTTFQRGKLSLADCMGRLENGLTTTGRLSHGIMMQSILVRSDIMQQVGAFDPIMRVAQDVDFIFRLAMATPLCYVNRPLVEIDRSDGRTFGLTTEFTMQSATRLALHEKMFQKWLTLDVGTSPQMITLIEDRLQGARSALANQLVLQGERTAAMAVLDRSLAQRFSWRVWLKREFIRLRLERLLGFGYPRSQLWSDYHHER